MGSPGTSPGRRPAPAGHRQDTCWTVHGHAHRVTTTRCRRPAERRRLFKASSPGACSNTSSSIKGMPTCLHKEFEEEITLPGRKRRAPADHWPESWRFRKEQGSGRWDAGYWRMVRLETLSKKQLQNLNSVLQHNTEGTE